MENLIGIILFLQVILSLQIMLTNKKVLQKLERIVDTKREVVDCVGEMEGCLSDNVHLKGSNNCEKEESLRQGIREEQETKERKQASEALLNEVLSEIFS